MLGLLLPIFLFTTITSAPLEFDVTIKEQKQPEHNIYLADEFNLTRAISYLYTINLYVGYPNQQKFEAVLDTGSFVTWIVDKSDNGEEYKGMTKYDHTKSSSYVPLNQPYEIEYAKGKLSGYLFKDFVSLTSGKFNMDFFKLLATTERVGFGIQDYNGLIGLGKDYRSHEKKFSIINYLKEENKIDRNVFSLKSLNEERGKFYLGDFHSDFSAEKSFAKCKAFNGGNNGEFWTCRLSYMLIGETNETNFNKDAVKLYEYAVIDSGSSLIRAPLSALPSFKEYFKDLVENQKECFWLEDNDISIGCSMEIDLDALPPVYLVLNGFGLKMTAKHLFINFRLNYYFVIRFSDTDHWLIGQPLFKSFHVLFNIEENYVGFQGEYKDFSKFTTDDDFILGDYLSYIVIGVIAIFAVIAFGVFLYLRRRKVEQANYHQNLLNRI
jgi:cathepsin D